MKKVHFMGIGGSGVASIALLAKKSGFEVTGCDTSEKSFYNHALQTEQIPILKNHDASHLEGVDICAISPAILDVNPDHPEVIAAKEKGILMTWQQFMAEYLQVDKSVVAIAGTHGKSTTTVLLGEILMQAAYDPTVVSGTTYRKWNSGSHVGNSEYFIVEADEFNRNFLHYYPEILVINNIEMDHPESFANFEEVLDAFFEFVTHLQKRKILIVNEDSPGVERLLMEHQPKLQDLTVIGYSFKHSIAFPFAEEYHFEILKKDIQGTTFRISTSSFVQEMIWHIPGEFNMNNAASAIITAYKVGAPFSQIQTGLLSFEGIGRRFDLVGEVHHIRIYDDYAHHPTAIRSVLNMCKEDTFIHKLWAVFEPHQISRLTLMFDDFAASLGIADEVIITKTHLGREIHKGLIPIAKERWQEAIGLTKTQYIEDQDELVAYLKTKLEKNDVVIVFGAANSYKISRSLLEALQK